jgi:hypothetical protein
MTKSTLANLYRQATRNSAGSALPDADTLLALANGERPADAERIVAEVAQSALQSDLLHFARALEPASAALSSEVATALAEERSAATHARSRAVPMRAMGRWHALRRATAGLAAVLVAVVAVWSQHKTGVVGPSANAAPDRIFAALNDRAGVAKPGRDEIFHGDFHTDEIFRASDG